MPSALQIPLELQFSLPSPHKKNTVSGEINSNKRQRLILIKKRALVTIVSRTSSSSHVPVQFALSLREHLPLDLILKILTHLCKISGDRCHGTEVVNLDRHRGKKFLQEFKVANPSKKKTEDEKIKRRNRCALNTV